MAATAICGGVKFIVRYIAQKTTWFEGEVFSGGGASCGEV